MIFPCGINPLDVYFPAFSIAFESTKNLNSNVKITNGFYFYYLLVLASAKYVFSAKHHGFKAIHRFALTPSPLSPGERGWGEGEMTVFARERHFFVCQIAKHIQS